MNNLSSPANFLRRAARIWLEAKPALALALCCVLVAAPALRANNDWQPPTTDGLRPVNLTRAGGRFDCGYDPRGADDEIHKHHFNSFRLKSRLAPTDATNVLPKAQDQGDVAVIEDDGTIIVPPNEFDLKNRSVLFTPEEGGYRVARGDIKLNSDYGYRLGFFFGVDNQLLSDANNGYRDIPLLGARFPFYGVEYDTVFIGTNGYVTFGQGDANARASASALATELPRIAPLWADLDATNEGDIYYNRLEGRHIITWKAVPQADAGGANTFQAVLYDDGRIAFVYKKVKARTSLVGISPGGGLDPQAVDLTKPPAAGVQGPFFESFSKQRRLDLPALTRAFYSAHADAVDAIYVWADFPYDNGAGVAHSFNVRNDVKGIGLKVFDRGLIYGSPSRLSTIITMGNQSDWPSDPQAHVVGLNSAISIVCHEQGHRWLAYIRFDAEHDIKDDLLGRENSHWSFLMDTRTNSEGSLSSLMEGNAWRDNGNSSFTTTETAVNYFSPLDLYLMGLLPAEDVGPIRYLATDDQSKFALRDKSPVSGFSTSAIRKNATVAQIVEREGPRLPDAAHAPKEFRIAFVLLAEQGAAPSSSTIKKMDRYREALVSYFSTATNRLGSLDGTLIRN
ncbi:MAG TPA: hypothetical protein VJZ26_00790 [Blastocatellia bacterium]|nr:hypothetical protein [Blastocatellia bacterium]